MGETLAVVGVSRGGCEPDDELALIVDAHVVPVTEARLVVFLGPPGFAVLLAPLRLGPVIGGTLALLDSAVHLASVALPGSVGEGSIDDAPLRPDHSRRSQLLVEKVEETRSAPCSPSSSWKFQTVVRTGKRPSTSMPRKRWKLVRSRI